MRRREFITLLGGAAAWPVAARAQQGERMRRIGALVGDSEIDPFTNIKLSAFTKGLAELGWISEQNLRIDIRWAAGDLERIKTYAKDLVSLRPEVILADTTPVTRALRRETQTIPIIFVNVADPVGEGFVGRLQLPNQNLTGFIYAEGSMAAKWLQLLLEIAPNVKRAGMIFNPDTAPLGGLYYLPPFQEAARTLNVTSISAPVRSDAEIESAIAALGSEPGSGLVVMPDGGFTFAHRGQITMMAARHAVPAVQADAIRVREGALLSYGPDQLDIFRRSATYVDRVLRGTKPADLPVQLPIKFEMAVNAKTARALGLSVPASLQQLADEVIE
jgi:putative ABC transport system substrate-binding protein